MKKAKNRMRLLMISVIVMAMLAGCGAKFDASGYTKAILDVLYKNETEQYMELTQSTQEEAEQIFEENLDSAMSQFDLLGGSDDLQAKYRQLFSDLLKQVKYSVSEAVEDENGNYTVDVTIEPITIFNDTYDEFQEQAAAYAEQVTNDVMNGGEMPSDEDMQIRVFEIYYDILRASIDAGLNYGEPEVVTVHVEKDQNNVYRISDEDIAALDAATISIDY